MHLLIILIACFTAALLSSMSGGGTNIIVLPVLLALGLPLPLVIAVSVTNSAFWVLPAARNYLKGRRVEWIFVLLFSALGLLGSYLAVRLVVTIEQRLFELIFGIVILLLVALLYFKKGLGLKSRPPAANLLKLLAYPFALLLGFYETVFGAGNGIAFTALTFYTRGFDFISALGHYYLIAFPWTVFSAYLLFQKGYHDLPIMMVAVIGSVAGAYLGSRYAKNKGNEFIKLLFVIIGGILGIKLLLGF